MAIPHGAEAEEVNRKLMKQAADVILASNKYLEIRDLTRATVPGITYGAEFEEGKIDDHGISQYLFKIAYSIVDDRIAGKK